MCDNGGGDPKTHPSSYCMSATGHAKATMMRRLLIEPCAQPRKPQLTRSTKIVHCAPTRSGSACGEHHDAPCDRTAIVKRATLFCDSANKTRCSESVELGL